MWKSNDIVEEERPSMPSEIFLQQPEVQDAHPNEAALHGIFDLESGRIERGIEGGTDEKMDFKVKQNTNLQNANQPVSQNLADQNQASQTSEIGSGGMIQQGYMDDLPLNDIKFDLDPGSKPQGKLPCPRCERRFRSSQGLQRHIQTHALSTCHTPRFKCSRCRRTFCTLFSRRRHEKRHDNRKMKMIDHTASTCAANQNVHARDEPLNMEPHNLEPNKCINAANDEQKNDKNSNVKASHVCKYCRKAFMTHTSLRRHQRRIHELQLLPRGVLKKVKITQEPEGQQFVQIAQDSKIANPQCTENMDQEREYMVDISSNISENLSFYIDGKIVSTSAVSNCEVIEMNSGGSAVIGLNAVIISPAQITQALKLESNASSFTPDLSGQSSTRRRTSTPPLLPQIKTELESESILSTSSSSLSSLTLSSTSGASLVTAHLPQCIETFDFHKEKTVYLSPKLKQLLQNQDGSKPAFALIADGQKMGPPLSLTALPTTTATFKRRTASPPSSPQQTHDLNIEKQDQDSTKNKKSKLENHEETKPSRKISDGAQMQQQNIPLDCSISRPGGNSCNQQPLDLSNSMGKRDSSEALADSILDLSIGGKSFDCDSAGVCLTQPPLRKSKPNSSMLQKVLMNEYGGVGIPSVEAPGAASVLSVPDITNLAVVAVSDTGPPNPEKFLFELALPPASINPTPQLLAPLSIHPAVPVPPPPCSSSLSPAFLSFLSTPVEPSQDLQTLHSTVLVSDSVQSTGSVEDCTDNSAHLSQGDLNVTIPDWVSSAPGGLETLIPTAPLLSLQSPHWVADPSVCELAQRTLVVDSLLTSDAQLFSPSLPVNQSNVTSLAFPPNTVVIEYTVALQSTENILPALQANSVQCFSDKIPVDALQQEPYVPSEPQPLSPDTTLQPESSTQSVPSEQLSSSTNDTSTPTGSDVKAESKEEGNDDVQSPNCSKQENPVEEELPPLHSFCKNFMCNVCEQPFQSMKILSQHVVEHSEEWPYKCEFCVQLFESDKGLLEHRSSYHGIGNIYVCKTCSKEFAFLCNLEQHQRDLHPGQECSHTEVLHGKLRPENHNSPKTDMTVPALPIAEIKLESDKAVKADEDSLDNNSEELFTTIKIMASGGMKPKGPDVRLGINQHYPSFKPPPFPYHNRTPNGTTAVSATNFTTHNIPQTFSTAIRCTKCGKSFDNMPELHKHILACANASDRKRYTPKKNPIPLKQFAKVQNGVLSPAKIINSRQILSQKVGHLKKMNFHESPVKIKMSILNKKKAHLVQRGRPVGGRKVFAQEGLDVFACPHCSREFTYNASLKKHVAFSCPMRPASRDTKKRMLSIVSAQENNGSLRRQIANMNAKPQGSNQGPKTITKSQIIKQNAAVDTIQDFRIKRSMILSTSVVQSSKKEKPILKSGFVPQLTSKQVVLSSVAQVNSQEPGVRVQVLGRKLEQLESDVQLQPRGEERLSLRLRERTGGPITRSAQQTSTTTTVLKQPESHNIIMRPVVLQVKK